MHVPYNTLDTQKAPIRKAYTHTHTQRHILRSAYVSVEYLSSYAGWRRYIQTFSQWQQVELSLKCLLLSFSGAIRITKMLDISNILTNTPHAWIRIFHHCFSPFKMYMCVNSVGYFQIIDNGVTINHVLCHVTIHGIYRSNINHRALF